MSAVATSVADPRLDDLPDDAGPGPATGRWWLLGLVLLVVLAAALGAARWTGQAPFGSDNDEYQLVARQLLDGHGPVVAGVEGSKYPFGYPAVLAVLDGIGLPLVDAALALNVALVAVAAGAAAVAARHLGALGSVVAAGVVLLSRPLWAASQSTMPDVLLTALVAVALALATATMAARRRVVGFAGAGGGGDRGEERGGAARPGRQRRRPGRPPPGRVAWDERRCWPPPRRRPGSSWPVPWPP